MKIGKIYVIHYTKLVERKERIETLVKQSSVPYEFILDYDQESIQELSWYDANESVWSSKVSLWGRAEPYRKLRPSEISCEAKHICAFGKISKLDDEVCLLLEDDALVFQENSNYIDVLNSAISSLPPNWDVLFCGAGCGINFVREKTKRFLDPRQTPIPLQVEHPASNCTEAFVLKKSSAVKLLASMVPFTLAADWELARAMSDNKMNVYWMNPPVFYQGSKEGQYISAVERS